jgi:hypothetical protein
MKTLIVDQIKRQSENKIVTIFDRIPAIIASVFSIIFSLSIVFELKNMVNGFVLGFLVLFVVLFLIFNEVVKVKMIKKVFNGTKTAILSFIITFLLSVGLSTIGIWFWTNKTDEIEQQVNVERVENVNEIRKDYNEKILNLKSKTFESTDEFLNLKSDLDFLKSRGSASIEERDLIRDKIYGLQETIRLQREKYNNHLQTEVERLNELMINDIEVATTIYQTNVNKMTRNNFVSYIFITLILITEFAIIILNKILTEKEFKFNEVVNGELAQKFLIQRNILESIYLTKNVNDTININNVKYSPANVNNVLTWDDIKAMYNNFIALDILCEGKFDNDVVMTNTIVDIKEQALEKFDNYYNSILKLKLS